MNPNQIPTALDIINEIMETEMNTKALIVTFNGSSTGVMLPFSEEIVNLFDKASVVRVSREWEGNIKEINAMNSNFTLSVVKLSDVKNPEPSKEDKLKAMKAYADKLDAERAALDKEMSELDKV
jgi:hypothetical protein